jgi:hypothetical protein
VNERPDIVDNSQNRLLWDGHIDMLERRHPQALGKLTGYALGEAEQNAPSGQVLGDVAQAETYFLIPLQYGSLPARWQSSRRSPNGSRN